MKIATEIFTRALELASRAAQKAGTIDILRCARLTAADGRFTLACNDMTMYMTVHTEWTSEDK